MKEIVNNQRIIVLIGLSAFLLQSCDLTAKYEKDQNQQVQDYLIANPDKHFELKPSGLYYLDLEVGTGIQPVTHDTAYLIYSGSYLSGTVFNTNEGKDTLIFPVNEGLYLPGLEEAVLYMKEGGKSLILMKSDLAYGNSGYNFPAYTPVVFQLRLTKVRKGPQSD